MKTITKFWIFYFLAAILIYKESEMLSFVMCLFGGISFIYDIWTGY